MNLASRAVPLLRVLLAVLFAVLVLLQVLSLPGQFASMAQESPEMAYLRWPLTVLSIFWVVCVQVVVVSTWQLLTLVTHDRIFSNESARWVDAIVGAITAAWVVLGFASLWVAFNADDPGFPILVFLVDVSVTVLLLLMLVLRQLLRQATSLRTDLEGVI